MRSLCGFASLREKEKDAEARGDGMMVSCWEQTAGCPILPVFPKDKRGGSGDLCFDLSGMARKALEA